MFQFRDDPDFGTRRPATLPFAPCFADDLAAGGTVAGIGRVPQRLAMSPWSARLILTMLPATKRQQSGRRQAKFLRGRLLETV
jgi:hypothetical protein